MLERISASSEVTEARTSFSSSIRVLISCLTPWTSLTGAGRRWLSSVGGEFSKRVKGLLIFTYYTYTCIHSYIMTIRWTLSRHPCRKNPSLLQTLSRSGRPGPVTRQKVLTRCHIRFRLT